MSVKISELPILDSLADNDVIAGVDTSANVTSKIEMATLKNYIDTNTQYTAGTNINITDNVISAPNVYNKTETDGLIDDLETNINEQLEEKDEQIEELQSEVDSLSTIYNAFPTESGEGESLTLDDTAEVKFKKFDLKGNTSQTTYSGKNLFDKSNYVDNYYISSTGELVAENGDFVSYYIPVSSGNYIISGANAEKIIRCAVYDSNQTFIRRELTTVATSLAITISNDEKYVRVSGYKVDLNTFQLEKNSSATPYEPYVGGTASPNPSYPQPVNVVSGDNEIQVCGKNLNNGIDYQFYISGSGTQFRVSEGDAGLCIKIDGTSSYTISTTTTQTRYRVACSNSLPSTATQDCYNGVVKDGTNSNITINTNGYKYLLVNATDLTSIQIEKGSSATDFEPYQGNTYNIDLPVENLLQCNLVSTTTGGVTITNNDDESFTLQGTSTVGIGRDIHGEITLKAGTYTFSADHLPAGVYISLANVSYTILNRATPSRTFTINTDTTYSKCLLWIDNGYTVNDTIKIQLEKGSKQNNFTPYGTTPIELCKIGNYQDYFGKSDGRNLFDVFSNVFLGSSSAKTPTISSDGKITSEANFATARGKGMFVELESNTTYTLSFKIDSIYASTGTARVFIEGKIYNETSPTTDLFTGTSYNTTGLKSITFTTPTIPEGQKCGIIFNGGWYTDANVSSTFSNVMIEKGSSASDYQPYGVGKWYLHKEIGKVVLNGSENITTTTYSAGAYFHNTINIGINGTNNDYAMSNYYTHCSSYKNNTCKTANGGKELVTRDNFDQSTYITWLGTNKPIFYYYLATPTNTEITYQPLIDQLNLLEKAMSKDSQTNISQVNNDLGFIIYAEAIKSLENVLDRIELLES